MYDRNFGKRAGNRVEVLLLSSRGSSRSSAAVAEMRLAFERLERVGGLPHHVQVAEYSGAAALAARCRASHTAIVFLSTDLDDELPDIRTALDGVDVLSVGALSRYVPAGVVLGFEVISGKPTILVNLPQAKKQNVDFRSDVLRLMKVYR